jgi:hypothetical protein
MSQRRILIHPLQQPDTVSGFDSTAVSDSDTKCTVQCTHMASLKPELNQQSWSVRGTTVVLY